MTRLMFMDLSSLTIEETKKGLLNKDFSVTELIKDCLYRIKKINPKLNAYLTLNEKEALKLAKDSDLAYQKKQGILPLHGIPICVKDNFCTNNLRTTASSKVLDNYLPVYDATIVKKLKQSGAIILGKTNMDSWAHGSSTETSDYGSTKNPWNIKHLPGGSSGGSTAAVSADLCTAGIGSETAGSIRQPSAWCGVVGFKPTYGRVSRYGLIAMASSTDSPGPITKTVADASYLLNILAGKDPFDATTSEKQTPDYYSSLKNPLSKITIGIPKEYFPKEMNIEVKNKVWEAIRLLEKKGYKIKEISLFDPQYSIAVYTILQRSEVSSNLARFDGIRYGNKRDKFNDEGKRRIMLGTYTLSSGYYDAYYLKAQKVRTLICSDFKKAFSKVDIILGPTSPVTALPIGASNDSFMFGELQDMLLEPSSIAGLPGISVPCGFSENKLPVGLQLIGPQFSEETILKLAYQYEKETEWHKIKPNI